MIESLEQSRDALERECAAQFLNLGRVSSTAVSSARRCLSHCRHDIAAGLQRREQMRQEVNAVEEEYRGLRVRCDGLEQLINRQKAEHRRQAFLAEQNLLDEAFRSRKFARQTDVADVSGDGDPETTQSGVTEQ